jgi:hypothetical protein
MARRQAVGPLQLVLSLMIRWMLAGQQLRVGMLQRPRSRGTSTTGSWRRRASLHSGNGRPSWRARVVLTPGTARPRPCAAMMRVQRLRLALARCPLGVARVARRARRQTPHERARSQQRSWTRTTLTRNGT